MRGGDIESVGGHDVEVGPRRDRSPGGNRHRPHADVVRRAIRLPGRPSITPYVLTFDLGSRTGGDLREVRPILARRAGADHAVEDRAALAWRSGLDCRGTVEEALGQRVDVRVRGISKTRRKKVRHHETGALAS